MLFNLAKYPNIRIYKFLDLDDIFQLLKLSKSIRTSVLKNSKILKMYLHVFHLQMRYSEDIQSNEIVQTNLKTIFFKDNFKFLRTSVNQMLSEFELLNIKLNPTQILDAIGSFLAKIIFLFKDKLINCDNPYFIKNYYNEQEDLKLLLLNSFDIDDDSIDFLLITLKILSKHNIINGLSLCNNKFSNEKIGEILQFASLNYLCLFDFSSNKISLKGLDSIFSMITKYYKNNPHYKIPFLDFSDCAILDEEVELIAKYLELNYPIERLSLNANKFTSLKGLAAGIKKNTFIKEIRINQMNLGSNTLPFLEALINNNTIVKLTLDKNDLSSLVPEMINVFQSMSNLRELSLIGNQINDESGSKLIASLSNAKMLSILSLGLNSLGMHSCIAMSSFLNMKECQIHSLELQYNKIDDLGVKELLKGMEYNTTIQYLELSWNQFTRESGEYFGEMLSKNNSLRTLNIKQNMLFTEGCRKILKGICKNATLSNLTTLGLVGNSIKDDIIETIEDMIERKKSDLKHLKLKEIVLDCNMITLEGVTLLESLNPTQLGIKLSLEVMLVD